MRRGLTHGLLIALIIALSFVSTLPQPAVCRFYGTVVNQPLFNGTAKPAKKSKGKALEQVQESENKAIDKVRCCTAAHHLLAMYVHKTLFHHVRNGLPLQQACTLAPTQNAQQKLSKPRWRYHPYNRHHLVVSDIERVHANAYLYYGQRLCPTGRTASGA